MKLNVSRRQTLEMENSRQQASERERTFVDYGLSTEGTLSLVSAELYHMRGGESPWSWLRKLVFNALTVI